MRREWIAIAIAICVAGTLHAADEREPGVIPKPMSMTLEKGVFRFTPDTRVVAAGRAKSKATALIETLAPAMGFRMKSVDDQSAKSNLVALALDEGLRDKFGLEGYTLTVAPNRIDIRSAEQAGLFYGVQTLRQLLPAEAFGREKSQNVAWSVPCLRIEDAPRFGWRGLLVDPARHFIPKGDMLRFIDAMAALKFNRLQIHLTDNQGWRLEIKKYPELTKIGSKMDFSRKGGGFYTQEEMREIVRYASQRHVTIVPEIEMPAHTGAAIVSYPQVGLDAQKVEKLPPDERWRAIKPIIAPRPETVSFMQNVLKEVMELFPGPYIHIGGDEANTNYWTESEEMQALMRELGHSDVHQLHSWFIKQMDAFVTRHGRRLIGWDEILQGGLAEGATVMSWRGMEGGIAAARAGHDVVMAPTSHTYFDYYQGPKESEPRAIGGFIPVEKVYAFEPIPAELTAVEASHILGGQGQLWGEFIPDRQHREYMAFPRACALSETLWSPKDARGDFGWFQVRLRAHLKRLDAAGVRYRSLDQQFDYFENNWNVVGLKDYRHGARITPDNELVLSGRTPVQIRLGPNRAPLSRAHGKRAMNGWMPIIQVDAADGPVRYEVAYWATPLPGVKDWKKAFDWPTEGENFLNWIRIRAVNLSDRPAEANIELGPNAQVQVPKTPEQQKEPKSDKTHTRTHTWSWRLPPGGSETAVARYPFFPVDDPTVYDREDADLWLERTETYWRNVMAGTTKIRVPCRKATEAFLAAHVCQLIASDHGQAHGGEDFYDIFYPRDGAYQVMELEEAGLFEAAAKAVEHYLACQGPDGRFRGAGNQGAQLDANGQTLWTLWQYYKITGDQAFLERVYPGMLRAARWTIQDRQKAPADSPVAGLLHAAPADGESLWEGKNHIVGYDLWNLRGLLCVADAARILGNTDEENELLTDAQSYRAAIEAAWEKTHLDHFPPSWEKVGTHWGDTEILWPTEIFTRDHPVVAGTGQHVREEFAGGFIEGTMQWKGGGNVEAIHPYMGAYTTMNDLARGEHEQVVEDFYWYLLHSTAANAFPEGIYYKKRMAWSHTIPHVTGACNYAILLRHMLIHESGNDLILLAAVPDWWLGAGQEIRVERAPTHFGEMSLVVRGTEEGVEIELDAPTRNPPKRVVLNLPHSRPLIGSLEGVEVALRSDQKNRWDFPAVVARYKETSNWSKPDALSLTTGKPVECSHALATFPARLANDGRSGDTDKYWATDIQERPGEAWWKVDLEEPTTVGRVVVVGYYGDKRFYGFTVETSSDGKQWEMVADKRDNQDESTARGTACEFKPRKIRHIRVTQTGNSANTGRHLVEVMAFEK